MRFFSFDETSCKGWHWPAAVRQPVPPLTDRACARAHFLHTRGPPRLRFNHLHREQQDCGISHGQPASICEPVREFWGLCSSARNITDRLQNRWTYISPVWLLRSSNRKTSEKNQICSVWKLKLPPFVASFQMETCFFQSQHSGGTDGRWRLAAGIQNAIQQSSNLQSPVELALST